MSKNISYPQFLRDKAKEQDLPLTTVEYHGKSGRWTFQNALPDDRAWLLVRLYQALNARTEKGYPEFLYTIEEAIELIQ